MGTNDETGAARLSDKVKLTKQVSGKLGSVPRSGRFRPTHLTALLCWEGGVSPLGAWLGSSSQRPCEH